MAKTTSSHGFRIDSVLNSAQKVLQEKEEHLDQLTAEHKKLFEEKKLGIAEYLDALKLNSSLLLNQQLMEPKVGAADDAVTCLEERNMSLEKSVKDVEHKMDFLALSAVDEVSMDKFEEQSLQYKQKYLDVKEFSNMENMDDNMQNVILEIQEITRENEKLEEELKTSNAELKILNEKFARLAEIPYEDVQLTVVTLKMVQEEHTKAEACLLDLKAKLEHLTSLKN